MKLELMEAVACGKVLALASDLGLQRLRIASDCLNLMKSIRGTGMGPYGQIIQEIKARSLVFGLVKFAHESRKLNMDVGSLTKSSICESSGRFVWFLNRREGVCNSYSSINQ
jgi:hypothetical protein